MSELDTGEERTWWGEDESWGRNEHVIQAVICGSQITGVILCRMQCNSRYDKVALLVDNKRDKLYNIKSTDLA